MQETGKTLLLVSPGDPVQYDGFAEKCTYADLYDNAAILDGCGVVVCAPFRWSGWNTTEVVDYSQQQAVAETLWKYVLTGGRVFFLLPGPAHIRAAAPPAEREESEPDLLPAMLSHF